MFCDKNKLNKTMESIQARYQTKIIYYCKNINVEECPFIHTDICRDPGFSTSGAQMEKFMESTVDDQYFCSEF